MTLLDMAFLAILFIGIVTTGVSGVLLENYVPPLVALFPIVVFFVVAIWVSAVMFD